MQSADADAALLPLPATSDATDTDESAKRARLTALRHRNPALVLAVAMAVVAFASYPSVAQGAIAAFIAFVVVVLGAIDLELRIIPNQFVLPATAVVLVARIADSPGRTAVYVSAALGAGLVFLIPSLVSRSLMGMGDVKFAAFLGAGMGVAVVGAVVVAYFSIFPVAVWIMIRDGLAARKSTIPFGPFLAFGTLVILIVPRLLGLGAA